MIQLIDTNNNSLIAIKLEEKISKEDVKRIHPLIHSVLKTHNKVNFYFEMENFKGYELKGLWEDLKVDASHFSDYGRMVFVGEKKWQEWAIKVTDFFTSSQVKYFDVKDKEQAKNWIDFK